MTVREARNRLVLAGREREAPGQRREGLKEPHTQWGNTTTMRGPVPRAAVPANGGGGDG